MRGSCEARVTGISFDEKRKLHGVELDETVFFPEGGGQFCDTGFIDGVPVLEVRELPDGRILHYIKGSGADGSEPYFSIGDQVTSQIDFSLRFDRMQQHTGEHIVSGIVHRDFGYENVGFHLGDEITTLDFSGELTPEDIEAIELMANRAVWDDICIKSFIATKEELKTLEYRSKKELLGDVRIVEIPEIDICACCAPHMERTGQVGLIKIVDAIRHRGGMRLTLLAGGRALRDYGQKHGEAREISALLSMKQGTLAQGVSRQKEELKSLRESLTGYQIKGLMDEVERAPEGKSVLIFGDNFNKVAVRKCLEAAMARKVHIAGVFDGSDENGYTYSIVSENVDLKPLIDSLNAKSPGKGGVKPGQANGRTKATEGEIREVFDKQ